MFTARTQTLADETKLQLLCVAVTFCSFGEDDVEDLIREML